MNILSWNVRNLSQELERPGQRGRGMPFEERVYVVAKNLERWVPDIAFLIEAGPDGGRLAEVLREHLPQYLCAPSTLTQTETFVCLWKRGIHVSNPQFIGSTDYRQGWSVSVNGLELVVLHAPSPVYSLPTRIEVISAILSGIKGTRAIVMGDFNIRSNEQQQLHDAMQRSGFQFLGPSADGNPVSTSLRLYGNILRNHNLQDVYSQPYDQFWGRNVHGRTSKVEPIPGTTSEAYLAEDIATGMEDCVSAYKDRVPYNLRDRANPDLPSMVKEAWSLFSGLTKIMQDDIQTWKNMKLDLPHKEFVSRQMAACTQVATLCTQYLHENSNNYLALAFQLLREFSFCHGLACCFLDSLSGGVLGLSLRSTAAFEHSISDHLPIGWALS